MHDDGTVSCWGGNAQGQLGNNSTTQSLTPVAVSGISTATSVATGEYHSCALLSDGTVSCWGSNVRGQLGNNATTESLTPVAVSGLSTATSLATGWNHSLAVLDDGTLMGWGIILSAKQLGATIISFLKLLVGTEPRVNPHEHPLDCVNKG